MNQIDWSKAPEDATHAGTKVSNDVACWYRDNGAGQFDYWYATKGELHRDGWKPLKQAPAHWPLCQRPAPVWNGEGKPPVGTLCEVWSEATHKEWAHHVGKQALIVCHDGTRAVYRVESEQGFQYHGLGGGADGKSWPFRPLRTTEQIAEEERQREISEIHCELVGMAMSEDDAPKGTTDDWQCVAELMHAKGYRKQVAP